MTQARPIVSRHAWVGPVLVVCAAVQLLASVAVFAGTPLADMPV